MKLSILNTMTVCYMLEGKAMEISDDMKKFARETTRAVVSGWEYDKVIHSRQVDGGKWGKRNVTVIPTIPTNNEEKKKGFACADPTTGEIELWLDPKHNYGWLSEIIVHELVHIFDPKLNKPELEDAPWNWKSKSDRGIPMNLSGGDVYYAHPWEQDAFMAQEAMNSIKYAFDWYGDEEDIPTMIEKIKKDLITKRAETEAEKFWYKNPKMWRKYLNTIYALFKKKSKRLNAS